MTKCKYTIEDMNKIAAIKKGKCLSKKYINYETKLEWECEKGHRWFQSFHMIKSGNWCPNCYNERRGKSLIKYTIEDMKEFAQSRGGDCLSKKYIPKAKLLWKCSHGHTWEAVYKNLKRGDWCPECNNMRYLNESKCRFILEFLLQSKFKKDRLVLQNGLELDGYNEKYKLAFEYNGQQHYEPVRWFNYSDKTFQNQFYRDFQKIQSCKDKGIKLLIIPYTKSKTDKLLVAFILKSLKKLKIKIKKEITENDFSKFYKECTPLDELKKYAISKGGECLSNEYLGTNKKLRWKCKNNHIWEAVPQHIKGGHWCPYCFEEKRRIKFEDIQKLAIEKGGKCLSNNYIVDKKLKWQCKEGHTWEASIKNVREGTWCPICARLKKRIGVDKIIKLVKSKKGKILSKNHHAITERYKLQCEFGHIWEASGRNVLYNNSWCPVCYRNNIRRNKNET